MLIRLQRAVGDGDAAGVGVLDDDARGLVEGLHAFERRVGVGDVVIGQLLALQQARGGDAGLGRAVLDVERGLLVRVLAVAQPHGAGKLHV